MIVGTLKSRQEISQLLNQFRGKVLVEEETHGLTVAVSTISNICREGIHGCEVLFLQTGMLVENLRFGHAVSQPAENIIHCDPHTADTWLTVPLVRLDGNPRVDSCHGITRLS